MSWTNDDQTRLDCLRDKELAGTLTAREQAELASLMAQVEAEEAQALAPEMNRLHAEISDVQHELGRIEGGNEELARLMAQQQALGGVSETSVGGELEIDHHLPQAAGGSDDIDNLVYACTACNRFKGDYAPARDAPESLRLFR